MSFLRSYHRKAMKLRLLAGDIPEWLLIHKRRKYVYQAILSFPLWITRKDLKPIEDEARRLTRMTGIPHEVDHIVPICHPHVCGLTVPWNLQILTQHDNGRKGGMFTEHESGYEQQQMFPKQPTEQYQLPL